MTAQPRIVRHVAGRAHGHLTEARADILATHRRASILKRLGGRPSGRIVGAAFEARQAARLHQLREMLRSRS